MRRTAACVALGSAILCSACAPLGPDYRRPDAPLPSNWKVVADEMPGWRPAQPQDARPRHDWWTLFADPQLHALEQRCVEDNWDLQAATARLEQAWSQVRSQQAGRAPSVTLGATAARLRSGDDSGVYNTLSAAVSVQYDIDLLGRIRREVEAANASAEQAAAASENVRLLVTTQVATAYFQLRQADEEIGILAASLDLQGKVLKLLNKRRDLGASTAFELARQSALMEQTQAQLDLLKIERTTWENALATLTGTPAASFSLASGRLPAAVPALPLAVPGELLERRPDIAIAERAMAAANAQIGVAQSAFFPTLSIGPGIVGVGADTVGQLLKAPLLFWSLGTTAGQTLFDGGRNTARLAAAQGRYTETVAAYRQSVLAAIQSVQDALASLDGLGRAKQRQDEAVRNQERAYRIGLVRYQEGMDSAFILAETEQDKLTAQRLQSQLRGRQFLSVVALIKATGGGWH